MVIKKSLSVITVFLLMFSISAFAATTSFQYSATNENQIMGYYNSTDLIFTKATPTTFHTQPPNPNGDIMLWYYAPTNSSGTTLQKGYVIGVLVGQPASGKLYVLSTYVDNQSKFVNMYSGPITVSISPKATANTNNQQAPSISNQQSNSSTGTPAAAEQNSPVSVGFSTVGIPLIGLDKSRCEANNTKNVNGVLVYKNGILTGVPCSGALKTLNEALIVVKNVVQLFLLPLIGILFTIMLIIGGILYITSRGNQQQLERAKKTLTAAIIGLLIVILSYTIIAIFASAIGGTIS